MGFEHKRAEHNGFAIHRLNHSATSSSFALHLFKMPDSDHQLVSRALNELNWVSDKEDALKVQSGGVPRSCVQNHRFMHRADDLNQAF